MTDLMPEVSFALAQVLGVGAIVGALLIWRAFELTPMVRRLYQLYERDKNGLLDFECRIELRALVLRSTLVAVATYLTLHFFLHTASYLSDAAWIAANHLRSDIALLEDLKLAGRLHLGHITGVGMLSAAALVVEWFMQVWAERYHGTMPPSRLAAAEVIPRAWLSAPGAMWESRIEDSAGVSGVKPPLGDWASWSQVVCRYREATADALLRDIDASAVNSPTYRSEPQAAKTV